SIVRTLEANRNGERQSCTDFINRTAIGKRVAKGDIEGELIADLPDQSDQPRNRLFHAELFLIKKLRDRPHLPLEWTFKDSTDKNIAMMVSRQRRLDIKMDRS